MISTEHKGIIYTQVDDYFCVGDFSESIGNALLDKTLKEISLIEAINRIPVTNIRPRAFYGVKGIIYIYIPDTITTIGYSAFDYMDIDFNITLPSKLEYIGKRAFAA